MPREVREEFAKVRRVKFGWWALGGLVFSLVACSAIVGVEDVRLRRTTVPRAETNTPTTGEDPDDEGDDDPALPTDEGGSPITRPECNGVLDCERLVFVTKATFTGKMGGLNGADQICFEAAKQIPGYAGRAFRAWLSDGFTNASTRIPHGTKPYRRTDGTVFATSYEDLTDGTINLPMLDEKGKELTGSTFEKTVWTATGPDGISNGDSCVNWNSEVITASGVFGDATATDSGWTAFPSDPVATSSCNAQKHLYCIEY